MPLTCEYFGRSIHNLPAQIKVVIFCLFVLGVSQCITSFSVASVTDPLHKDYMATGLGITGVLVIVCSIIIAFFSEHTGQAQTQLLLPKEGV